MDTCTRENCDQAVFARSVCQSHYNQQRRAERRDAYLARDLICRVCGTTFHRADPRAIYCSRRCVDRAANDAKQARKVAVRRDRSCPFCGVTLPREKDGKAAFCSLACQLKQRSRLAAAAKKAARR